MCESKPSGCRGCISRLLSLQPHYSVQKRSCSELQRQIDDHCLPERRESEFASFRVGLTQMINLLLVRTWQGPSIESVLPALASCALEVPEKARGLYHTASPGLCHACSLPGRGQSARKGHFFMRRSCWFPITAMTTDLVV